MIPVGPTRLWDCFSYSQKDSPVRRMGPTAMIEVQALAKYFGRFSALRDLNLRVDGGEFIALFGRNGAGKTTFLRILAGLSRASSGTVQIRASSAATVQSPRGCIGFLSHNTALYPDLTALENLRFFARLLDLPDADSDLIPRIEKVGLAGREREPVRNYSRGMQQRLAIARAFLHDPAILLLDEPFTGLDQPGTDFLKAYLAEAHAHGKTCLMAIHDAAMGHELADRLIIIEKGVVAVDMQKTAVTVKEFQEKYRTLAEGR
jgi:heme exporter protein A